MNDKLLNMNSVSLTDYEVKTMYLFIKTETTGLIPKWAQVTDLDNLPRMVQIAWILTDDDGNKIVTQDHIIKPENYKIPFEASMIHGITTERAMYEGVDLSDALHALNELIDEADYVVAHNMSFHEKIIGAEFLRSNIETEFFNKRKICTMTSSIKLCKIPGVIDFKYPKLSELYYHLFNRVYRVTHDAITDLKAVTRCFNKMKINHLI